jgi:hypothetical protein
MAANSLNQIAKRAGVDGGWRELYEKNRTQVGSLAGGAQDIAEDISSNVNVPEETFRERYAWDDFFPDYAVRQFAESQVNPEYNRIARQRLGTFDRDIGQSGAWRTGEAMNERQNVLDEIDRSRKAAVQDYIGGQEQLFRDWYNREMESYMTDPSKYVMTGYEDEDWYRATQGANKNVDPGTRYSRWLKEMGYDISPKYENVDFQEGYNYGGYGAQAGGQDPYNPITYKARKGKNIFDIGIGTRPNIFNKSFMQPFQDLYQSKERRPGFNPINF